MVAEAVSSPTFQRAVNRLGDQKRFEVEWAIGEIEDDPSWHPPYRYLGPADSPYSGFIIDLTVEGFGIVYKIVDQGAAVELWYLYRMPPPPKAARTRRRGPAPVM
jgi:hypothetical protein